MVVPQGMSYAKLAGVVTFAVKGPMRQQTSTVVAAAPEAASAQS